MFCLVNLLWFDHVGSIMLALCLLHSSGNFLSEKMGLLFAILYSSGDIRAQKKSQNVNVLENPVGSQRVKSPHQMTKSTQACSHHQNLLSSGPIVTSNPPFIPKVGPCDGWRTQANVLRCTWAPRAWARPIVVVLFPSPRGVGVILTTAANKNTRKTIWVPMLEDKLAQKDGCRQSMVNE